MNATRFMRQLALVSALSAFPVAQDRAPAQEQPAASENRQDELITINKIADPGTESFKILRSGDKFELNRYVTKVYHLQNANPFEMIPYIKSIVALEKGSVKTARNYGPDGKIRMWLQVNVPEYQIPYLDQAIAAYDVPNFISAPGFVAFAYKTQHRSAAEITDYIARATGTAEGKRKSDPASNTIYFQESPSDFMRVYSSILFADQPIPQVDMEVTMIEVTNLDNSSLGLYWDAWKSSIGGEFSFDFDNLRVNPAAGPVERSSLQDFGGLVSIDATALASFLNYLSDDGAAKVLVRTNLTVSTGKEGVISSSTGIPGQEGGSEGILVRILPEVAMQSVGLDIEIEMHSPVGVDPENQPIFSDQKYSSHITVSQDQLYKIGGLRRSVTATETRGIPGLKSIPFVKWLFRNEVTIMRRSNVYLFIKPTWTATQLPDATWKDFHRIVDGFTIDDVLKNNPNIQIGPGDAEMLRRYFDNRD